MQGAACTLDLVLDGADGQGNGSDADIDGGDGSSDYLGVRQAAAGGWQADISLRLDADGRPGNDGETSRHTISTDSELGE